MTTQVTDFDSAMADLAKLTAQLRSVIVGQESLLDEIVTGIFAGGHLLLEGLPGLGKTHLAKALAASFDARQGRIQCTPDLLPADITGSEILGSGGEALQFQQGPIFANLVLVDEINRATPRTQAALLEAMQERQVTYAGRRHELPAPFWVIATQNPIELEGTFPLPEAQLDRFLFKLNVPYPDSESLDELLTVSLDSDPVDSLRPAFDLARAQALVATCRSVLVADAVRQAAISLILATQPDREQSADAARRHVRYGASPRALQSIIRAARVRALLDGRAHVATEDLGAVAVPALRHRVLLQMTSELDGFTIDAVVREIIDDWASRHI
jgi:MoxR-like ATPase